MTMDHFSPLQRYNFLAVTFHATSIWKVKESRWTLFEKSEKWSRDINLQGIAMFGWKSKQRDTENSIRKIKVVYSSSVLFYYFFMLFCLQSVLKPGSLTLATHFAEKIQDMKNSYDLSFLNSNKQVFLISIRLSTWQDW